MKDTVGVYYSTQNFYADLPAFFVDRETAREWLRNDAAWSVNHGRNIALNPETIQAMASEIDARKLKSDLQRAQSQVMGETVVTANADHQLWAVRITQGWSPRTALIEHLISLRRYREIQNTNEQ